MDYEMKFTYAKDANGNIVRYDASLKFATYIIYSIANTKEKCIDDICECLKKYGKWLEEEPDERY